MRMKLSTLVALLVFAPSVLADAQTAPARDAAPRYRAEVINPTLSGGLCLPHSNTVLLWGTDGSIWRSDKPLEWTRGRTDTDADLSSIAANEDGSVLIAVGQRGTILRSTDRGRRWSSISIASITHDLRSVAHHAAGDIWIATGVGTGVLRSVDAGRTWRSVHAAPRVTFGTLASDPKNDTLLIGGEDGVIGYSRDRGESWDLQRIEMPGERTPIAMFYRLDTDVIVATSAYGRVLVSDDRGASWRLRETGARGFFTAGAVARDATLWLATHTGELWRSTHRGTRFERVVLDLEHSSRYISAVDVDTPKGAVIIAGHGGLLARADDEATHWQSVASPSANLETMIAAADGRYIASGEGGLIMESMDSGRHWQIASPALDDTMREIVALPRTSTFVAAGTLGAVLRSVDGGATWRGVNVRYPNINTPPTLRALLVNASDNTLLAAGPPGTIMRSTDRGASWDLRHWTPFEAEEAFPWILGMADDRSLVTIEANGAFYRSRDGGTSWQRRAFETKRQLWHGATLRARGVSVAAGQQGVAAISRDDGASWHIVDTATSADLYGSFADELSGALFLMGEGGTLLRSADRGKTWEQLTTGVTHALRRMLRMTGSETLLAFGAGGAIIRSHDGIAWEPVHSGTASELRKAISVPDSGETILIGEGGTAIASSDGSMRRRLPTNTRRHFRGAAIDERGDLVAVGERVVRVVRDDAATGSTRVRRAH